MRRLLAAVGVAVLLVAGVGTADAHTRPRVARTAPSLATWDRLAQCESGGNWHIRGRRYSGGVQFADATWRGVGGRGRAADASKDEQIARATTLYLRSGWGQWPGCSRRLRLR